MPGLIGKRSHEVMEAGSRGNGPQLQNPETADGETPRKKQMMDTANGVLPPNPEHLTSSLPNGSSVPQASEAAPDTTQVLQDLEADLPPELPSSVDPQHFKNLGLLVDRMAQNTFESLIQLINRLGGGSDDDEQANGDSSHARSNFQRKKELWDFTHETRAKYIKLLVLSKWGRNAAAFQRLIDICAFMVHRGITIDENVKWVGALIDTMTKQNLPAPDITTTLQTMSEGKADWISDMGFIPDDPLPTAEILYGLKRMNTLLTFRLGLHDQPPECMRTYSIRDGRVTFKVQDEFELDLTLTDDDNSSPLCFVDLRFTFSSGGGSLPDGRIRNTIIHEIESRLRQDDSFQKTFDFLHNLILTHKIAILNLQARGLRSGRWGNNIDITEANRALVVEYWRNRPGGRHKKNWIEIGIRKRRPAEDLASGLDDISHLAIRWHRHGQEVLHHDLDVDVDQLSLETILKDTIAAHTNYILAAVKKDLTKASGVGKVFKVKHHYSPVEPADCSLSIRYPDGRHVTLAQEPITGSIGLLPSSGLHSHQESKINVLTDPASQCGDIIRQLRAASAAESYTKRIAMNGWARVSLPRLGKQTLQKSFHKPDVYRVEFCRPPHWTQEWCFALTHHLSGCEIWHLMRLKEDMDAPLTSDEKMLGLEKTPFRSSTMICYDPSGYVEADTKAEKSNLWNIQSSVPLQNAFTATSARAEDGNARASSFQTNKYAFLFSLAAHGAAIASQIANGDRLAKIAKSEGVRNMFHFESRVAHSSSQPVADRADGRADSIQQVSIASLCLKLWNQKLKSLYKEDCTIDYAGVYSSDGAIVAVCRAELQEPMPVSTETLRFDGGALQVDGKDSPRVAVQLVIKIGDSIILKLIEALLRFAKVISAVHTLQKHSLDVRQVEFNKIEVSLDSVNTAVVNRGYVLSPQQLRVIFLRTNVDAKHGVDAIEFDQGSPYARNAQAWQEALSTLGLYTVAHRLPRVHQVIATVNEMARMDISVRPYVAFRDTRTVRLVWGPEVGETIGLEMTFVARAGNRAAWGFKLVRNLKPELKAKEKEKDDEKAGDEAPSSEAINKLVEAWMLEFAYKKGKGFTATGELTMIVDVEDASTTLWRVFDLIKPFIAQYYEAVLKKQEAESVDAGDAGAVDAVDNDKAGKPEADKAEAAKQPVPVVKKPQPKKTSQTITID